MKKKIILLSSCALMSQGFNQYPSIAEASETTKPYVFTRFLSLTPLDRNYCIELIKKSIDLKNRVLGDSNEKQVKAQQLHDEYNRLSKEIDEIESGPNDSIEKSVKQLNEVIESLYNQAQEEMEGFHGLSEEEQANIIKDNELVKEWQAYIEAQKRERDNLKIKQTEVENEYKKLNYEIEQEKNHQETEEIDESALNQSLLYPYSTEIISKDSILLNPHGSIDEYLMRVNNYLQSMVPSAYSKVTYDQIYKLFYKRLNEDDLERAMKGKTPIKLDTDHLYFYSYAYELSLQDIETIVQEGQRQLNETQDMSNYVHLYQLVLQLKNDQYQYFYEINDEAFQVLKENFVNYLNNHLSDKDELIDKVSKLQEKYQLKLVFYDENRNQWVANDTRTSGFHDAFMSKDFLTDAQSELGELDREGENQAPKNETGPESTLDRLKNKLSNTGNGGANKNLPRPSGTGKLNTTNGQSAHSSKGGKELLPNTGESSLFMWIASIIGILGIGLLSFNIKTRKQQRKQFEETKLD